MDFHILTPAGPKHICSLIGGQVVIAPPALPAASPRQTDQAQNTAGLDAKTQPLAL